MDNLDKNESSKDEIEKYNTVFRSLLTGIYYLFYFTGSYINLFTQEDLNTQFNNKTISEYDQYLLENLYSHVGNVTDGFTLFSIISLGDFLLSRISKNEERKAITKAREILPFIAVTLMFGAVLDTETLQIIVDAGTPDVADIPAGMFGILAGVLMFERYKLIYSKFQKDDKNP